MVKTTVDTVAPALSFTDPAVPIVRDQPAARVTLGYSDADSGVDPATFRLRLAGIDVTTTCSAGAATATCQLPTLSSANDGVRPRLPAARPLAGGDHAHRPRRRRRRPTGSGNYQTLINDALTSYIQQRSVLEAVRQVVREELSPAKPKPRASRPRAGVAYPGGDAAQISISRPSSTTRLVGRR